MKKILKYLIIAVVVLGLGFTGFQAEWDNLRVTRVLTCDTIAAPSGELYIDAEINEADLVHMFSYFGDSTVTFTIAGGDTWYHLTNAYDSLWRNVELDSFTVVNDSIIIKVDGDYMFDNHLSYEGSNGVTYSTRFYNVTQSMGIPTATANTARGAGNIVSNNIMAYGEGMMANDTIVMQMKASGANNATLKNSTIRILFLHD